MTTRHTAPSGHVDGLMPDDPTVLEDPEAFDPPAPRRAADRTAPTERTERESTQGLTSTTTGASTASTGGTTAAARTSPSGAGSAETAGPGAGGAGDSGAEAGGAAADGSSAADGISAASRGGSPRALSSDTTRPARVGGRAGALALIARSWRQLTSMRTALVLLFMLAVAAVPGSLLPQRNVNPMKVEEYLADHGSLASWLDRFSFFDVFGAPWFAAIYLLLFISLIGCLWSRVRWHARALFTAPPKAPSRPGRLPGGSTWTSPFEADEAVLRARGVLRGRRFRVAVAPADARRPDGTPDHSAAAEKGYLRETGNLVFHLALVALLAGMGFGSWFGYQGTVLVITGNGFANTLISYDQYNGGELVDPVDLPPFSVMLDRFEATYQDNGQPADFRADVRYAEDRDAPTRTDTVRVNHPLAIGNAKIYLIGHGYAPHFVLRDPAGEIVWESYVPCTPRDGMFTSTCTVKIPDTGLPPLGELRVPQQLAFSGVFTPTTVLDPGHGYVSVFPAARAPGLTLTGFVGNLHLNEGIPQNVYTVDTRDMTQFTMTGPAGADRIAQVVAPNNPQQRTLTGLPGGLSLEVDGVREFATFQTKSDPFKGLVLVASVVIIAGLIASLRVRRRRVWVRATPLDGGGSTVEIGGLSRSDAQGFAAELTALTRRIRDDTAPEDVTPGAENPSTGAPSTASTPTGSTATPGAATPTTTSSSTSSTTSATSEREP
ncbi:cytochrome c biogenesis protein ResB [Parafrankia sp. FMc2]|uniref:cytochrome c biogenesis protein ResB n=1 Tax=Parafrankia sp. FMc2 TaxID=3233196 RepID=UPI0034D3C552